MWKKRTNRDGGKASDPARGALDRPAVCALPPHCAPKSHPAACRFSLEDGAQPLIHLPRPVINRGFGIEDDACASRVDALAEADRRAAERYVTDLDRVVPGVGDEGCREVPAPANVQLTERQMT